MPINGVMLERSMMSEAMGCSGEDVTGVLDADIRAGASIREADMSFASVLEGTGSVLSHLKTIGEGSNSLHGVSWSSGVWTQEAVRRQESAPPAPVDGDHLTGGGAEKGEPGDDAGRWCD